jgi:hypothetical protein
MKRQIPSEFARHDPTFIPWVSHSGGAMVSCILETNADEGPDPSDDPFINYWFDTRNRRVMKRVDAGTWNPVGRYGDYSVIFEELL